MVGFRPSAFRHCGGPPVRLTRDCTSVFHRPRCGARTVGRGHAHSRIHGNFFIIPVIAMKIKPQPFKRDVARHRPARRVCARLLCRRLSAPKLPSLQVSRTSRTSSHLLSVFSHLKLPFNSYSVHSSPTPRYRKQKRNTRLFPAQEVNAQRRGELTILWPGHSIHGRLGV